MDDLDLELKPKKRRLSYISTGLSDLEKDFASLQDMKALLDEKTDMTAAELLAEVERQIQADKLRRMKREAKRHASQEDDE